MGGNCPEGGAHHWNTSSTPDPETKLYNATCRKCGVTTAFSSAVPQPNGFKHKSKDAGSQVDEEAGAGGAGPEAGSQEPGPKEPPVEDKVPKKRSAKKKARKRVEKRARRTGCNFKDPASLRAKEEEHKQRMPEIIKAFLREGTYYQAAKVLGMKRNTLRQLIIKWEESGDVEKVRQELMKIEHPCRYGDLGNIEAILGEMVSLDKSDEKVKATVTFAQSDLVYLRLGAVEMRFISQEIIQGEN